ncbi:HMG-Y-related protein A [Camellia lanceoleosa]|uniref:HMG-Y-related protein A n=1 Tax=Camellia lanceoleosa TaxID=1840588 RepID=A0ACC0FAK8_9ERIC|nr:HMG-Y-related protein A [Camellia lanceoleosa]
MDPTSYPPPAAAAEPPAYLAPAANPTPLHAPINHPPYAEMITEAITALKEKDGSSRQAIAKYIEKAYSNLPATHSTLLTHQLKRLKNTGQLVMVKHSYMLPRSVPHPLLSPPPPPPPTDDDTGNVNENALSSGPKRGPGRPPKPKMLAQPSNSGVGRMLVSLGLVDGSAPMARRGPGRPPKSAKTELGNRARGRPPRPKSLSLLMGQGGLKRMPGRPPKTGPIGLGRPRGRPPKNVSAAAAVGGGDVVAVGGGVVPGKRRGRRPRADGLRKVNVGVLPGKRRGRRPIADGVKMPRQLTGKPLGRPRKNSSITGIQAAATQQSVPYEDLKNKVEHFQSRIKHAVNMVKPYMNSEAAFGALQELEELAAMDLNAPLNVPVQGQVQEPFLQNL